MSHSNTASATPNSNSSSSPVKSLKSSASSPKPPSKYSPPPPIPIPHLLLDRSRLKPVPRPQPTPLQPPPAFNHLIPFRSKLRSTTSPNITTQTPSNHPPIPNNNSSSRSISGPQTSLTPADGHPTAESIPAHSSPDSDQSIDSIIDKTTSSASTSPSPNSNPNTPLSSDSSSTPNQSHSNTAPDTLPVSLDQIATQSPLDQSRAHSPMDDTLDDLTPPLSSESTPPDQSSPSSPQDSSGTHSASFVPQDAPIDNNQDQIQPWQNQLTITALDHSNLERANSAAARLDSLARLNGVRIPEPSGRAHNLDVLPPFLMAKHIEETKKKAGGLLDQTLVSHPLPLANYPLPLPVSLGFSVGPNGRGVPRLSALQRKALEKIANQQGSPDLSTATTSLTRSHTTTGTESRKHVVNCIQPSATDESHERQQARSNLIRKLSSRGANSRPKFPIQPPPPTQSLGSPPESANNHPLRYTPELASSLEQPEVHSSSSQDQSALIELFLTSHPPVSPNSAVHSFDLNQVELSQLSTVANFSLDTTLRPENEPVIRSKQTCISDESIGRQINASNMTSSKPHQCAPISLRSSLNLSDSHTNSDQPTQLALPYLDTTTSDSSTPSVTSPPSPVAQPQSQQVFNSSNKLTTNTYTSVLPNLDSSQLEHTPKEAHTLSFSSSDSQSALTRSPEADADARPSGSHHPDHAVDSSAANETITQYLSPAPCSSSRSSIASRLKARASLSSRIDRSTASGRPASPNQHNSQQPFASNEKKGEHRRSATHANSRISRPSYPSTLQRVRNAPHETSEDHARKSISLHNRGSAISPSKPLHHGDRPLRPTRAPPIAEAHNVVGRGLAQQRTGGELGPSQFPPTSNLVRTHMPVASAVDLARYNDQKLAPFPGLLNITPPSSPERSRSPRSNSKTPKSANHGILSSASNFFRSPTRRSREDNISGEIRATPLGLAKDMETLSSPKYSMHMSHSNEEEEEEVVSSSRWQSIGDVAEKMSSPIQMSRASTGDSNRSSTMSLIANQRRKQILARLSPFLKPPASSSSQNSRLHDPPRKLLWHQPVLQVANSASFKDRYLFLFNDILVITKPLLEFEDRDGERVPKLPITLKQSFLTKSVVELKDLRFMSTGSHVNSSSPDVDSLFKEAFHRDPSQAIQSYLDGIEVQNKDHAIAKLLLSTPDFDKRQLGQYLSGPEHTNVLRNYLEQMNLAFMRVEDALRAVLLSLRLPADPDAITRFLEQFGTAWTTCNPKICLSASLVTRWATATIVLSEHLHDGLTDSMRYVAGLIELPNKLKTEADFLDMVKADYDSVEGKSSTALPADILEAMLKKAYQSIRRDRLVQARANAEDTENIHLSVEEGDAKGLPLPNQITYQVPSELITISIPKPDHQFGIKLFGPGLSFEPSFLSFSHSQTASFRMKGKAIGTRQISFVKIGRRAAAYEGLPLNAMVSVERAFMKHTVQVGFYNHLSVKRKYLISFHDSESKAKFTELVTKAQNEAQLKSSQTETQNGSQGMGKIVALQVLRDTLILNEDLIPMNVNPYASTTVVLTTGTKKNKTPKEQNENPEGKKTNKIRSNSLSETYIHTIGKHEKDLHQAIIDRRNQAQGLHVRNKQKKLLKEQFRTNLAGGRMGLDPYSCSNKENPVGVADENQNQFLISRFVKTGLHLIQHCEQNSLIPLVLSFLSMGVSEKGRTNSINNTSSKVLNSYTSLGNLHTSQNHENDSDENNKTIKKQICHLDNRLLNHHHPNIASYPPPPSSSSLFNLNKLGSK